MRLSLRESHQDMIDIGAECHVPMNPVCPGRWFHPFQNCWPIAHTNNIFRLIP